MNAQVYDIYESIQEQISQVQKFKSHLPSAENRIKHEGMIRGLELALQVILESEQ